MAQKANLPSSFEHDAKAGGAGLLHGGAIREASLSIEPPQTDLVAQNPDIVRSVVRALGLLRLMNLRNYWTLQELHDHTVLPKATLWRLLSTLRHEGYVLAEDKVGTYRLTAKVTELHQGCSESNLLGDIARTVLIPVTKKIKWPLALGTLDFDSIVVRFTSAPYSPLALYTTIVGQHRTLLNSAMGRAYMSFCSANELAALLEGILATEQTEDGLSMASIERDLARVREMGYAVRHAGHEDLTVPAASRDVTKIVGTPPLSSTLAVPILLAGTSIGALSMTTFPRCMTASTIEKHCPILIETAQTIAAQYKIRAAAI